MLIQYAIGWLTFLIERGIVFPPEVLSIWGVYDPDGDRFCPVDGLREKLDACQEDGVRILAVPSSTLEKRIEGMAFRDYARQQGMHVIQFPDDMPISEVYPFILAECQRLGVVARLQGNYEKARQHYTDSLRLKKEIEDFYGERHTCSVNLGNSPKRKEISLKAPYFYSHPRAFMKR